MCVVLSFFPKQIFFSFLSCWLPVRLLGTHATAPCALKGLLLEVEQKLVELESLCAGPFGNKDGEGSKLRHVKMIQTHQVKCL